MMIRMAASVVSAWLSSENRDRDLTVVGDAVR
jgi:hypothetical protein